VGRIAGYGAGLGGADLAGVPMALITTFGVPLFMIMQLIAWLTLRCAM